MDKTITARVYRVDRDDGTPRLLDVLRKIDGVSGFKKREKKLAPGFDVRLEFLEEENTHVVSGELLRIQSTNYPSDVTDNKRKALDVKNRLGHSIVFRYNHHKGVLAIQYDPRLCGPGRLFSYVQEFDSAAHYKLLPILREDAWTRLERTKPRKIQISVASPSSLGVLDGEARAAGAALASMGRAYDAPKITLEIKMGHSQGEIRSGRDLISGFLKASESGDATVEKLRAFGEDEERGIDFLR